MKIITIILAAVALIALPWFSSSNFYINICTEIFIFCIFASSYNLLIGYGGLLSLGHAAPFGLASYVVAISVVKFGVPDIAAIFLALAICIAFAAITSALVLRTSGLALMMTTLAIGQLLWGVAGRWVDMTGGDAGLSGLKRPVVLGVDLSSPTVFYYLVLAIAVVAVVLIRRFIDSPFGNCLRGVRDQPRRMDALGHDVWMIRYITLVYASFWAAVAGVIFAYFQRFVSPFNLGIEQNIAPLIMVILGGVATTGGPLLGAAVVIIVERVVSSYVAAWPTLLGLGFVITVMFAPEGLTQQLTKLFRRSTTDKAVLSHEERQLS